MANTIKIKRGAKASIPVLSDGELGYCTDTQEMYVGNGGVNRYVGSSDVVRPTGATMTGTLTLAADPSAPLQAATKQYVDTLLSGVRDVKGSVRACYDASLNLSYVGALTIDGVVLNDGDRILLKNQTQNFQNGIYIYHSASAVTRAPDFDENVDVTPGAFCFVEEGTLYADTGWIVTSDGAITVGSSAIVFQQFSGGTTITAGYGLEKIGNQIRAVGSTSIMCLSKISVQADEVTCTASETQAVKVKDSGIGPTQLAASVAGNGLTGGAGVALGVGNGDGLSVTADQVAANIDTAAGLKFDASTPKKMQVGIGAGLTFSSGAIVPDFGSGAGKVCQGNDARLHTQGSDTGTSSTTFQIQTGSSGVKLKNNSGNLDVVGNDGSTLTSIRGASLISSSYQVMNGANATAISSLATAARAVSFPDLAGTVLLDSSTIDGGAW